MFIKFTRLDGTPIWINSTFVVTVEPRRNGGSVVVPIGDGLDYDVREAPEKVLALIGGSAPAPAAKSEPRAETIAAELARPTAVAEPSAAEPAPEPVSAPVVAVPPPKALPEKFVDVVANSLSAPQPDEVDSKPIPESAVTTAPGATITVSTAEAPAPAKKTTRKRKTKAEAEAADGEATEKPKKAVRSRAKAKKPALPLDEAQIERLKKMAPGSVKKLQNTLASQFRIEDPEAAAKALEANGVFSLEQDHVVWSV